MAYKVYKTSYLMKLTKAELIDILRTAEHNYLATEEALNNSAEYGKGLLKELEALKKADLQPVKHGKWIEDSILTTFYTCSNCKSYRYNKYDYCPNCGARMDGDNK